MNKLHTTSSTPLFSFLYAVLAATIVMSATSPMPLAAAAPEERSPALTNRAQVDACALLSLADIAGSVGNPVLPGEQIAGQEVCRWGTEELQQVSVLLMVWAAGSTRGQLLCTGLREGGGSGEGLAGVADLAFWQFSDWGSLFNSGELETCGPKGYIRLELEGRRDEAALKESALKLFQMVVVRTP